MQKCLYKGLCPKLSTNKLYISMKTMENRQRLDLTEWVIHFVHDRKPEDNLEGLYEDYLLFSDDMDEDNTSSSKQCLNEDDFRYPDYYDSEGNGHNILDEIIENEFPIDEDASAFSVLKKILHDGFIHSSWSIRNGIPSVYGPNSAVCFTEMPLYALVDYARVRGEKSGYVGNYGIAFRRNELYAAGARPVIYGLSGEFKETHNTNDVYQGRLLDSSCGIGVHEQYRYVSTLLPKKYGLTIDWTHEREWRWALPNDRLNVPGIPFFLSKDYADFFTEVIIIVGTNDEQEEILLHLKNLYDSGCRNTGFDYNKKIISSAKVLSLEAIANEKNIDFHTMKIEDLPMKQLRIMPEFAVSDDLLSKVKQTIAKASEISVSAVKDYLKIHPEFDEQKGWYGFANVCTCEVSEVTQALLQIKAAKAYSDGDYLVSVNQYRTSNLDLLEVGANAVAEYLSKELGQPFYVNSRPD